MIVFKSDGDIEQVLAYDAFLEANKGYWLAREIRSYWKRVLKRIDVTSRSLVAVIEPGSCFAGTLAEIVLACDRSYMLIGPAERRQPDAGIDRAEASEFRRLSDAERDFAGWKAGFCMTPARSKPREARSARCSMRTPPRSSAS